MTIEYGKEFKMRFKNFIILKIKIKQLNKCVLLARLELTMHDDDEERWDG
jgi:hypothetical protein